ncbi:MAG: S41 family peptidase [Desulfomonile tiedjei]|nr:S41 family peptidase [Desulfomonile tiedjei]
MPRYYRSIWLLFLLTLCLPAAADTVGRQPSGHRAGPLLLSDFTVAQRVDAQQGATRGGSSHGSAPQFFEDTIRLVKENYVEELSDDEIFLGPLARLTLTLPPPCADGIVLPGDCDRNPRDCLMAFVQGVAVRCRIPKDQVFRMVLNALLPGLDPNSGLLDAGMLKELSIGTSGKFGGVGMVVTTKDGDYVVISPFEGSPAFKAGIQAGDTIVEIDGQQLHGLPLLEVLRKVRGPAGSVMSVAVRDGRSGAIRRVRIRRQVIHIPPVRYLNLGSGIGYLRIVNFQQDTADEVRKVLSRMSVRGKENPKGLILDLRDNPGGLFDEAIDVADQFLPSGTITSIRGRNRQLNREFAASPKTNSPRVPIVVLINKGTASASEILAGALQGRPDVRVVGEKSFGKASVQAVYPLRNGSALRLTTAHYYTPDGRDIEGKGLEPDIMEEVTAEGMGKQRVDLLKLAELEDDKGVKKAMECLLSSQSPGRVTFPTLF